MLPTAGPCLLLMVILCQPNDAQSRQQPEAPMKLNWGFPRVSVLNFTELAAKHGYAAEEHNVVTEDGYILTMFRIRRGRHCFGPVKKIPVILMHGLLMNSDCWLDAGPRAGLAFLISDLCYDLWIPNSRGNNYAKKHIRLDPAKDFQFWDFEQLEFGYYDLPAFINRILSRTGAEKINYIGHSQGCGALVVMNSERPEYSARIGVNIFMAPATRLTNMRSLFIRFLVNIFRIFLPFLNKVGISEVLSIGGKVQEASAFLCTNEFMADTVCRFILAVIDGWHPDSIDTETVRVLAGHFPAGTSTKNMAYYGQAVNVDGFRKFDYGSVVNVNLYGSVQPPAYNLSAVKAPTVIIHGRNDRLTSTADIEWLAKSLPHVSELFYVVPPLWNHIDFTYSKLTGQHVLPKIKEYLQRYSG